MKKKTRQTGLLLSVLMLATTSLYPVSAFAEETTEAPTEAVSEAAEKSDAKAHAGLSDCNGKNNLREREVGKGI